jgi:hypothetical protein
VFANFRTNVEKLAKKIEIYGRTRHITLLREGLGTEREVDLVEGRETAAATAVAEAIIWEIEEVMRESDEMWEVWVRVKEERREI